jgi:predicted NUDIX family phosphoesterase
MKFSKSERVVSIDEDVDLSEPDTESIDHSGILAASIAALAMILIGILTADIESIYLIIK